MVYGGIEFCDKEFFAIGLSTKDGANYGWPCSFIKRDGSFFGHAFVPNEAEDTCTIRRSISPHLQTKFFGSISLPKNSTPETFLFESEEEAYEKCLDILSALGTDKDVMLGPCKCYLIQSYVGYPVQDYLDRPILYIDKMMSQYTYIDSDNCISTSPNPIIQDNNLTFDDLVNALHSFAQYPNLGNNLTHALLGLGGEVGEVLDKVKKYEMQGLDLNNLPFKERLNLCKEVGDVIWYSIATLFELGFSLRTCMFLNFLKLSSRSKRGKIVGSGDNR